MKKEDEDKNKDEEMNWSLLCVLVLVIVAGIFAAYDKQQVIESLTRDQLLEVLHTNGFAAEPLEGKDNLIRMTINGLKGTLIISKTSLQYFAAARGDGDQVLAKVNKWNQDKKYSRSYVDKDNDPILELDLDMAGGVTFARVEDYLVTVTKSLMAWMMSLS